MTRTSRGKETVGGGPSRSRPAIWGRRPGCPAPGGHRGGAVKRLDRTPNCGQFLTVVEGKKGSWDVLCCAGNQSSVFSVPVQMTLSQAPTCTCTVPSSWIFLHDDVHCNTPREQEPQECTFLLLTL